MRVRILILLLVLFSILFTLTYFRGLKQEDYCRVDEDCVPAQCCHPTGCVNKRFKPDCKGVACTLECKQGTMDCGQGYCVCIDNECKAVIR